MFIFLKFTGLKKVLFTNPLTGSILGARWLLYKSLPDAEVAT